LGSSFRKQLWEAAVGNKFRGSFSSFGEQLCGAAFDNNFMEQIWGAGAALYGNFERPQLWEAAFGSNFAEQFSGVTLERNHFGKYV
jgi:hypothetical protein